MRKLMLVVFVLCNALLFGVDNDMIMHSDDNEKLFLNYDAIDWEMTKSDVKTIMLEYPEFNFVNEVSGVIYYDTAFGDDELTSKTDSFVKLAAFGGSKNTQVKKVPIGCVVVFVFDEDELMFVYTGFNYSYSKAGEDLQITKFNYLVGLYTWNLGFPAIELMDGYRASFLDGYAWVIGEEFGNVSKKYVVRVFMYNPAFTTDYILKLLIDKEVNL